MLKYGKNTFEVSLTLYCIKYVDFYRNSYDLTRVLSRRFGVINVLDITNQLVDRNFVNKLFIHWRIYSLLVVWWQGGDSCLRRKDGFFGYSNSKLTCNILTGSTFQLLVKTKSQVIIELRSRSVIHLSG